MGESFNAFVASHYDSWEALVDVWLFQRRSQGPFFALFHRPQCINSAQGNVETVDANAVIQKRRRKLQNSLLFCRHCEQTFTSRISFKIHQDHHLEEAKEQGILDGELTRNHFENFDYDEEYVSMHSSRKVKTINGDCESESRSNEESTNETIEAVKKLMTETKDERSKRGKYFKYR